MKAWLADESGANVRGALIMTASSAAFAFNDTFMKLVSSELPLFQAIAIRAAFASAILLVIALLTGQRLSLGPRSDRWRMGLRVFGEVAAAVGFLGALFKMNFNNAGAIAQVTPLVVAVAAAIWLGERLGPSRLLAVLMGFVGVFLILLPGPDGFNWWSLAVIASVLAVTLRDIVTRQMSREINALSMALAASVCLMVVTGIAAVLTEIRAVSVTAILELVASASFLVLGYLTAIWTMRIGDVTFVAPFRYTNMVFVSLVAYFVFGDALKVTTLVGVIIVIAAGIFSILADRRVARSAAKTLH